MEKNIEDLFGIVDLPQKIFTMDKFDDIVNLSHYGYKYLYSLKHLKHLKKSKKMKTEQILNKLQKISISMMDYRNKLLEQEKYQEAREIHHILGRSYRYFAKLVASQDREIFLILSDYWRRGGESFWKPSSLRLKEISPSKTKEEDNNILITEYEDLEKIKFTKEEEEEDNAERETKINIQKEKDDTTSSGRTIFNIGLNRI